MDIVDKGYRLSGIIDALKSVCINEVEDHHGMRELLDYAGELTGDLLGALEAAAKAGRSEEVI